MINTKKSWTILREPIENTRKIRNKFIYYLIICKIFQFVVAN
jgi:hypothetical protein